MANFDTQIQALAGTATQSEMDEWMSEGVKEIINVLPPKLKEKCATITVLDNSATTLDMDGVGDILHVTRENADSGYYTPCRKIPSMYGDLSNDSSDIIHYATATDPVYWIDSNSLDASTLFVKPTPTAAQNAKAYHISYPTVDASAASVIANFPDEAEYLVVLYSACKVLQNKMNEKSASLPTISLPVAPVVPTITTVSYTDYTSPTISVASVLQTTDYPSYTSPKVGGATESLTASIDGTTSNQLGNEDDWIDYSKWFQALSEMIEDDEDVELASAQIEKIKTYLSSYNMAMQDELNTFNEAAAKFQALVQKATTDANYQMQKNLKEAELLQNQRGNKAVKDMEGVMQTNNQNLAKFQQESALYASRVNESVQRFSSELQKHTTDYQWLQGQYVQLKADYQQGLQMLIGGAMPQQQEQRR